jgi:hypothetical protein
MAVSGSHLVSSASGVDATSYATASITPTANRLVLAAIVNQRVTAPAPEPTLTGNGLTWVSVATQLYPVGTNADRARITVFRALGAAPSAGAVTIDFAGDTQIGAAWSISEFSGVDTGGTNGSAAVGTPATAVDTGAVTTLVVAPTFTSADHGTYCAIGHGANENKVEGAGFTLLGNGRAGSPSQCVGSEWRADNDTTADMTWATGVRPGGVAVELKVPAAVAAAGAGIFSEQGGILGPRAGVLA